MFHHFTVSEVLVAMVLAVVVMIFMLPVAVRRNLSKIPEHIQYLPRRIWNALVGLAQFANRAEVLKYRALWPIVWLLYRFFRLSPNKQTLLRGVLLSASLACYLHGWYVANTWLYIFGWSLDLTDGATVHFFPATGSKLGKFLDPAIDIPFLITSAFLLAGSFPHPWVSTVFGWSIVARLVLWLLYWRQYRPWIRRGWMPTILGHRVEGRLKAVVAVVAYGLVQLGGKAEAGWLPEFLIGASVLLEIPSLIGQAFQVRTLVQNAKQQADAAASNSKPAPASQVANM